MLDAATHVFDSNFVVHKDSALVHIAFKNSSTASPLQCKTLNFLLPEL